MKILRILGILVLIAGIAAIMFSNYITNQVTEGKAKIASGEKSLNQANQLFSLNPVAKQVGKSVTRSGEKKIAMGKEQIAYYENLAQQLMVGGIIGCVVGGGMFIISLLGSTHKRH